jgi:hypothetical protein
MSTVTASPGLCSRCWTLLSNTYYARIAAALVLTVSALVAIGILFAAHMRPGNPDDSTGEAIYQYMFEIGVPSFIYITATFAVCGKKRRTPKYNILAPFSFLLLVLGCIWMLYWVHYLSGGVVDTEKVPIDDVHFQLQPVSRRLADGINDLCQYSAWYITYLLGLDIWAASAR